MASKSEKPFWKDIRFITPVAITLIIAFFGGLASLFNWWGNYKYDLGKNEILRERDKAQIAEQTARNRLDYQEDKNINLEQENRNLRDSNRKLEDNIAALSKEIEIYKSRTIKIPFLGAGEVHNNQFIAAIGNIGKSRNADRTALSRSDLYLEAAFYYVGDDANSLELDKKGNRIFEHHYMGLELGQSMYLKFGKLYYCVRLLQINEDENYALFSQYTLKSKPKTIN